MTSQLAFMKTDFQGEQGGTERREGLYASLPLPHRAGHVPTCSASFGLHKAPSTALPRTWGAERAGGEGLQPGWVGATPNCTMQTASSTVPAAASALQAAEGKEMRMHMGRVGCLSWTSVH